MRKPPSFRRSKSTPFHTTFGSRRWADGPTTAIRSGGAPNWPPAPGPACCLVTPSAFRHWDTASRANGAARRRSSRQLRHASEPALAEHSEAPCRKQGHLPLITSTNAAAAPRGTSSVSAASSATPDAQDAHKAAANPPTLNRDYRPRGGRTRHDDDQVAAFQAQQRLSAPADVFRRPVGDVFVCCLLVGVWDCARPTRLARRQHLQRQFPRRRGAIRRRVNVVLTFFLLS